MSSTALFRFSAGLLLLWASGCASPRGISFAFADPTSVVARAWRHIDHGYAREEGNFSHEQLKLSAIDYSSDGTSVEVSFYVVASFKTDADGGFSCKLLDIEMDKNGKFISASTADRSHGVASHTSF